MKFVFQPDTDKHINVDSRKFYASKYCKDHLLKQLTPCHYTLMVLKKKLLQGYVGRGILEQETLQETEQICEV